ncbi:hypothetical protein SSCG_02061 [Streptomyces clavuligerus]|nr:hypothetical protein SSCG_02061 [Streptomyces clavuligerus]
MTDLGHGGRDGRDRSGTRVLVAPDKFKGSLTALQVAERVTAGLRRARPGLRVTALPVADGGDGTVATALAEGFPGGMGRDTVSLGVTLYDTK